MENENTASAENVEVAPVEATPVEETVPESTPVEPEQA